MVAVVDRTPTDNQPPPTPMRDMQADYCNNSLHQMVLGVVVGTMDTDEVARCQRQHPHQAPHSD